MQRGPAFISDLLSVIPNSVYFKRGTYDLKKVSLLSSCCFYPCYNYFLAFTLEMLKSDTGRIVCLCLWFVVQIVEYAKNKDFTSLIVVHTNRREPGL